MKKVTCFQIKARKLKMMRPEARAVKPAIIDGMINSLPESEFLHFPGSGQIRGSIFLWITRIGVMHGTVQLHEKSSNKQVHEYSRPNHDDQHKEP